MKLIVCKILIYFLYSHTNQRESILSPDCSKPARKCVIIRQQSPHATRSTSILPSAAKVKRDTEKLETIISKTLVTLSWRESCILGCTPLTELNPSLSRTTNEHPTNSKEDVLSSPIHDPRYGDHQSGGSFEQLRGQPGQGESVEFEELTTPQTDCDTMSEFSSSDLLGVWFKTADSATQKVPCNALMISCTALYMDSCLIMIPI